MAGRISSTGTSNEKSDFQSMRGCPFNDPNRRYGAIDLLSTNNSMKEKKLIVDRVNFPGEMTEVGQQRITAFCGRKTKFPIKCNYRVPHNYLNSGSEFQPANAVESLITYETSGKM
jgi:hypothetical protein